MRGLVITQGYGPSVPVLPPARETFVAPVPASGTARRRGALGLGLGSAPYVGSAEVAIAFGLDFAPWLDPDEDLAGTPLPVAMVMADPFAPSSAPYDASTTFVGGTTVDGTMAVMSVHTAVARTRYVVTLAATTTAGRVLECQMPPIDCPQ